jgi:hypothetical protein
MLVARAQLNFISELVARFGARDSNMRPIADYQSQYIAIVAMLRSVGHVFEKVDCADAKRRAWSKERWQVWKQDRIFSAFIEPERNALLKEFRGGLQLHSDALDPIAVVADRSLPAGASRFAGFDVGKLRDLSDRPVLPQLHHAVEFWDRCLKEAEFEFPNMTL